ncbi:unnamed protein product [Arabidopsis thaliana]|uniref:F-box domain-containing protein n=1 Tax=Arabidopsis thaliana TaxID=3702 RepID=A0A5S9WVB3_ARATH|nr:unnamed protein product [Arabidopsis thaliana]
MRKKKKKIVLSSTSEAEKVSIPYLPDDLLLNCLARISRLYYPTLSLVSKRFRSLLASTELYETRRLLGTSESCLYFFMTERRNDHELFLEANMVMMKYRAINNLIEEMLKLV